MEFGREDVARLIGEADRGTGRGPGQLRGVVSDRLRPQDRTQPVAREWLRRWRPARVPAVDVIPACACPAGPCPVCN